MVISGCICRYLALKASTIEKDRWEMVMGCTCGDFSRRPFCFQRVYLLLATGCFSYYFYCGSRDRCLTSFRTCSASTLKRLSKPSIRPQGPVHSEESVATIRTIRSVTSEESISMDTRSVPSSTRFASGQQHVVHHHHHYHHYHHDGEGGQASVESIRFVEAENSSTHSIGLSEVRFRFVNLLAFGAPASVACVAGPQGPNVSRHR